MDDFLLDTPASSYACNSAEDLKEQLAALCLERVTETRAEHISATFEFPSSASFSIPDTEDDDPAAAAAAAATTTVVGPSPVRDGPDAAAVPGSAVDGRANRATREIRAHDALVNQPADDPVLQKAIARHVIKSLGGVDNSSWTVRSISRGAAGWSFHYLCRHSMQAWRRQTSKGAAKVLVGESSGKDGQDPVNLARPAFDCRGSVTIAFVKNSRMITVKLEHTPFHKTVADLAGLYEPPPPPAQTEPRRRDRRGRKRKSRAVEGATNQEGPKKKRKKKSERPPEGPNAGGGGTAAESKTPQSAGAHTTVGVVAAGDPGAAGAAGAAGASGGEAQGDVQQQHQHQQHQQHQQSLLNLSPSETARRHEEATRKLRHNGVDPSTLSSEQFDIFANQSPELQSESLAMLIQYGAERLRIVHPDKDEASSSNAATADGATSDGSARKKKKKYKDGTQKAKKTRGSCQSCRTKKRKCSQAKPECSQCVQAGLSCYYPPPRVRRAYKSAEVAQDEPEESNAEVSAEVSAGVSGPAPAPISAQVAGPAVETAPPGPEPEEEASDLGSPGFNSSYPPAPEAMPQPADTSSAYQEASHGLYHQHGTGDLAYSQAVPEQMPTGIDYPAYAAQSLLLQQAGPGGIAYPHQPQPPSQADHRDLLGAAPAPAPEPVQPVQAPIQRVPPASAPSNSHHRMPSGSGRPQASLSGPAATTNDPSWPTADVSARTAQTFSGPPPPRNSRPGEAPAAPVYDISQQDELRTAAILSQAALQKTRPPPAARTASPFQAPAQAAHPAARAKPRQGQRPQNSIRTASPLQQIPSTQVPPPASTAVTYNPASTTDTHNVPSYEKYPRYDTAGRQGGQATSRRTPGPYLQQQDVSGHHPPASHSSYDAYSSRSHTPTTSGLAGPTTQAIAELSSGTAAGAGSAKRPNGTTRRDSSSYGKKKTETSTSSAYDLLAAQIHQHQQHQHQQPPPAPGAIQSFNARQQSTTHSSRTKAPTSYKAGQPAQRSREQPQPYSHYASQSHDASAQQQQQQQQQQQHNWYGLGSANNTSSGYGASSRGPGSYGQPGPGSVPYGQRRDMGHSGSTYQGMNDQQLYEMLRSNQGH